MSTPSAINSNPDLDEEEQDAAALHKLAESIIIECKQNASDSSLETAIFLLCQVLAQRPPGHESRQDTLNHLVLAMLAQFAHKGRVHDLDEVMLLIGEVGTGEQLSAILQNRSDIMEQDMITMDDEEQLSMTEIALNGISEFQQAMQLSSIESAVQLHREALLLRPTPNPQQYLSLLGLAGALIMQCYCTEKLQHLDEAIALLQEVLLLPSCPDLEFHCLLSLCFCYCLKFSQTADPYDMRDVVLSHMKANDGYQVAKGLLEDGTAMYKTFQELGQVSDLEEAVSLLQAALLLHPFPHPNRSLSLNNLSGALLTRFEQMGQFCDLEESISLNREALDMTSSSYPNQNRSLNNLANALLRQYEHIGYLPDLEESISLYREALKTPFDSDPSSSPNNLPTALMARFSQTGQLSDLEEAISLYREMLDLNPLLHPNRDSSLNNLANALKTRFEEMGQFCDVEESISLHREALGLRPPPNPDRPSTLNNLAGALMMKFEYMDDKMISEISNLEESITLSREALILRAPSSPYRPQSLNNLATALMRRFEQMSELSDLEESISFHREVVNLLSLTHPIRSTSLRNLANALWRKFQHTDQLCDLEESISSYKAGIKLLPINHPKHDLSEFLAKSLVDMYLVTKQPSYLSEAMTAFHKAVTLPSSSILHRFEAAKAWADYADVYDHSSALEAYQHAINLLPYLAALGMDLKARLAALSKANGLACDAASCAIEAGQLEKAVEFLSEGRAVFWTQALQLRNSFDELQSVKPELSDKLQSISAALEKASHRDSRNMGDINQNVGILEQEASHCRILNDEWNCTIDEVRKLNGFQNFLQPKPFHALQRAAKHGPIVLLNASRSGCDGLILTSDGVQHVPLPDITITTLQALCVTIKMALSFSGMRMELPDAADTMVETVVEKLRNHDYYTERGGRLSKPVQHDPQDLFRDVLGLLWFSVVHPVIQALGLQKSEFPTRLWWCPTGPFAFLPLHAAGVYDKDGIELESISSYVISSYTLTLDAMLAPVPHAVNDFKMLAAIQPDIPGKPLLSLPFTRKELKKIEEQVPSQYLIKVGTPEEPTSIEKVLSHLSSVSIAHFACHGMQNLESPLDSALLLGDGDLKVSRIMKLSMPNASLVYLSACQTAMGDKEIPDEAMHIAATMLFAGFHGVVGTMWSIGDNDAPDVAETFYAHLFKNGTNSNPDTTEAARALHLAVKKLRMKRQGITFRQWVPFIHLGI